MAVKKKIIINERGRFACQAYIESATALSDIEILDSSRERSISIFFFHIISTQLTYLLDEGLQYCIGL